MAIVVLAATVARGWSCGFEDPNSATMQRVMLTVVYPESLHVQGAADAALRAGALKPEHFTRPGDFFALQRTTRNLDRLAGALAKGKPADLAAFSVVLMGPVLWTRFRPDVGGVAIEPHADGPLPDKVVVVSDVPALAALVAGDVSAADAMTTGLVRFYGDPAAIVALRGALDAAFPTDATRQTGNAKPSLRAFDQSSLDASNNRRGSVVKL
ncbi:hypothetical protein [Bauldia litoralis]|uniref:hypothetical protein n=1 Tax=Bauldia litoralis TaxID=665467 RepID=UPI000B858AC7|nr:hypothetical protein [Bauldia litoralis]